MLRSLFSLSGRYSVVMVGLAGLLTSLHMACSFDSDPPSKRGNPVTDSGPLTDGDANDPNRTADASNGGYYGYGYGPDGCYGYGYGYATSYDGYNGGCD